MVQTDAAGYLLLEGHQGRDARDGWRAQRLVNVEISSDGLRLVAAPSPPVPLKDAAGTLGGLANPTGVAVGADGTIYVADGRKDTIYRIRRCDGRALVEYLPCLGGQGHAPRQFDGPRGLAISPVGDLYVADSGNHRIQVFALRGLVLRRIWGRRDSRAGAALGEFDGPADVAVDRAGNVFVADTGNARVQQLDCRQRRFVAFDGTTLGAHLAQVLYGQWAGDRFVYVPARRRLERWPRGLGRVPETVGEVEILGEDVPTYGAARQCVLDAIQARGATDILVEWFAAYPTALAGYPQPEPSFSRPVHLAVDLTGRLYVVDQDREYVKVLDGEGRVLGHVTFAHDVAGPFRPTAVTVAEDGDLIVGGTTGVRRVRIDPAGHGHHACVARWQGGCAGLATDGAEQVIATGGPDGIATLPPAAGFERNGVYVSAPLDSEIERCAWHRIRIDFAAVPSGTSVTVWTHAAETRLSPEDVDALPLADWQTGQSNAGDFLNLSPAGRYLWLKIELRGNGVDTPVLERVKAYFPRVTYLQYLPAVYQADPVSKDFLERFLSIFETILGGIETRVDTLPEYFDPMGAPPDFLSWLAAWVDMAFDPSWSIAVRRRLLRHAPDLYRQRGTRAGLAKMLSLALGVDVRILEHFRLRRWLFLSAQGALGERSQLWGDGIVSRLQLNENSRIGDFALVGTGDPVRDPFHVFGHKFTVFVPAAVCRSEVAERRLRALIEQEKPAHTQFTLTKVEGRFRVGVQSTIGLDTLVGAYPHAVLGHCSTLGYDAVLAASPEDVGPPALRVGTRARVGVDAVVG